ncbi:GDP-mannose 4,6 dehydratase [Tetrabaena socialis]|uniref:GDP-mannose 4,6-dehydratase n=1 Tax=Tetrabaena socialis TaxID=47790 RepID=A0A2J8AJ63_9CHLO|nr:GDP-mannose 4,6 dehydratase [Tetrabaena socialis]|eukprot:PNH12559.1 GDP-mannose 4,6 dehydratase [Tetrabaena socialis]
MSTSTRVAFITGAAGQDGSFLAELLIGKGYTVYGMVRRSSNMTNLDRLTALRHNHRFHIHYGDVTDIASIMRILTLAKKDYFNTLLNVKEKGYLEVYNLAAQSHVKVSFEVPQYTANTDAIGTLNVLEAVVQLELTPHVRLYQASTSELFGSTAPPQNEESLMCPQSPYAVAKLFAHWAVKNYRDAYNMYAVSGILFNHESERRAANFVTRKITKFAAALHRGQKSVLEIGNLHALRDWGYAKDYVEAMWAMLQQDSATDFVIATGEQHTVKECIEAALEVVGIPRIEWRGTGLSETGHNAETGDLLVEVNAKYFRPTEVDSLQGDCRKATDVLKWKHTTGFKELVKIMVLHDIQELGI